MSESITLQDAILKECVKDRIPLTLFLMNGFQLRGVITGWWCWCPMASNR